MKEGIRGFRPADKQQVLALWNESGIARPWLDLDAEIDEKLKRDPEFFLVAAEGDKIMGVVMGAYDGRRGWIYHLAVAPDMQSHGLGRKLVGVLETRMAEAGVRKINLQIRADNASVTAFYEKAGYQQDELVSMSKVIRQVRQ